MDNQPAPFDAVAREYDAAFSHTALGRLQRALVHDFLEKKVLRPGIRVLELNGGTAEDAIWLAARGARVRSTDLSADMVAVSREKVEKAGFSAQISCAVLDIRQLRQEQGAYDLIFSNFGGLNCISPEELPVALAEIPRLLAPGGYWVAVVMGRFCFWETLYFLWKGRWRSAFRRWRRGPVQARLSAHSSVATWYYAPSELPQNQLTPVVTAPVGCFIPPSYLEPFFGKRPRMLRFLNFLEKKCRFRAGVHWADHYLIAWRK
jgi:ubiquinone/menaquinone biosynthesis C-methylase UbiE